MDNACIRLHKKRHDWLVEYSTSMASLFKIMGEGVYCWTVQVPLPLLDPQLLFLPIHILTERLPLSQRIIRQPVFVIIIRLLFLVYSYLAAAASWGCNKSPLSHLAALIPFYERG